MNDTKMDEAKSKKKIVLLPCREKDSSLISWFDINSVVRVVKASKSPKTQDKSKQKLTKEAKNNGGRCVVGGGDWG
jgi:hypothetical protein